ncbi:MAG: HAD family phosphatase [Bdellovibrionota bacterium]
MPQIRGVFFDFDDCLAPTEKIALGAACALTNREVVPAANTMIVQTFIEKFPGMTYRVILAAIMKELPSVKLSSDRVDQLVKLEEAGAIAALRDEIVPTPGSLEVLEALRVHMPDVKLAVSSSSASNRLEVCLDACRQAEYFGDRVYSAQTTLKEPRPKPLPDINLHALKVLDLDPSNVAMIEDSKSGMLSSTRAGIAHRVGYVGSLDEAQHQKRASELFEAGAQYVIRFFGSFLDIIKGIEAEDVSSLKAKFGAQSWKS